MTFDIQEGPRVYVERINISGNTRTLDKVIRREFRLAEGDAFITAKVRRSQQRLKQPRLLREGRHLGRAGLGAGQDQPRGPGGRAEHRRNLVRRRLLDDRRASWATSRSRERNLLGKGQDLRLGLSLGTLSTLIDLSFTEPYFLDRTMAAGFDIFRTSNDRQNVASYSDRSIGFALRAGWAYTEHTRQNVRYTLRQTDIYNVQPWASTIVQLQRRHVGRHRRSPRPSPGTRATRASTRPRAGCCATRWRWRAWSAPSSTTRDDRGRACTTRRIIEDFVASIGGSVGVVLALQQLDSLAQQPVLHRRRHAARLPGRRHRSARCQHDRLAGRHILLHRDRPSSASRSACPRKSASSARRSSMSDRCGARRTGSEPVRRPRQPR